jgi:hypothetical protein
VKEKLLYSGKFFDSNNDGLLNKDEVMNFFCNFYRFVLYGRKKKDIGFKGVKQRAKEMTNKLFFNAKNNGFPGISISTFASIDKNQF